MMPPSHSSAVSQAASARPSEPASPPSAFRRACVWALLLAALIEIPLFGFFSYPVDSGFQSDATLYGRVLCTFSLIVHFPGLVVFHWLVRHHGNAAVEMLVVVAAGYFDVALLLLAAILLARRLHRGLRRSPAAGPR